MGMNYFRISLIGTGGYGESVVVQLGPDTWMVVDSCVNPKTKEPLPLLYLKSLGVNVETDVKLIVCSHWHNDHIIGMDKLLEECKSAVFSFAITSDKSKFLEFIGLDSRKDKLQSGTSSTDIMARCLEIVNKRRSIVKPIIQDRLLFKVEGRLNISVFALSPSDTVLSEFGSEISQLINDYTPYENKKIVIRTPNEKCVALQVCVNNHTAILGGDLEASSDNKHGWLCILNDCTCISKGKASLFKIPHHGSNNAYEEKAWNVLFDDSTLVGQLSPFIHGKTCIPTKEMLSIFLRNVKHLYITSYKLWSKPKKREHQKEKLIQRFNQTLQEITFQIGIIENYIDLDQAAEYQNWGIKLYDNAFEVDASFVEKL